MQILTLDPLISCGTISVSFDVAPFLCHFMWLHFFVIWHGAVSWSFHVASFLGHFMWHHFLVISCGTISWSFHVIPIFCHLTSPWYNHHGWLGTRNHLPVVSFLCSFTGWPGFCARTFHHHIDTYSRHGSKMPGDAGMLFFYRNLYWMWDVSSWQSADSWFQIFRCFAPAIGCLAIHWHLAEFLADRIPTAN